MTQPPSGETPGAPDDIGEDFDRFLDDIILDDGEKRDAELADTARAIWLTDKLKSSGIRLAVVSYPDGSSNQTGITVYAAIHDNETTFEFDCSEKAIDEQRIYAICLDILRVADNPNDGRFAFVQKGKREIIAITMLSFDLPFDSRWVDFLKEVIPGGGVLETDIKETMELLETMTINTADVTEDIIAIFEQEREDDLSDDREMFLNTVEEYIQSAITLIHELTSGSNISVGERDRRLQELATNFAISEETQTRCFELCAALCGYDASELI